MKTRVHTSSVLPRTPGTNCPVSSAGAVRGWALGLRLNLLHHGRWIEAKEVRDESNDDAADANAASGNPHPAPIFNVVTCALLTKVHARRECNRCAGTALVRRDVVSERIARRDIKAHPASDRRSA